ncbi:MAG: YraN family protein [Candidatus Eremiobacteraeota bacterium]|nr:YraN family protein [Candidatus Eremiobacteraeota bacterium]
MNARQRLGRDAEEAAAAYLTSLGLRILGRNVRGPSGEIDIIARDGETIVFVEVKARRSLACGPALDAVDLRKRRRLRAAAADYLQFAPPYARARFDVLAIDGASMRLHRAAFA